MDDLKNEEKPEHVEKMKLSTHRNLLEEATNIGDLI